jgi:hypothetical protein
MLGGSARRLVDVRCVIARLEDCAQQASYPTQANRRLEWGSRQLLIDQRV